MFLSTNAALEFKRKLCICFSDSHMGAVLSTIDEADEYKDDINKYVNEVHAKNMVNEKDLAQALGVQEANLSDGYYEFEDDFLKFTLDKISAYARFNEPIKIIDEAASHCITAKNSGFEKTILITKEDFEKAKKGHSVSRLSDIVDLYKELGTKN